MARPVCIPTACRRLEGQLLLPALFPQPGVSPESLQTATALDIFWLLQGKSGAFILKDRLRTCESRQVMDDEEEGRGNNTESGFQCFVKESLGLTCSSIFLKMSCLKMAACLFEYLPGCCCSCSLSFMCKVSGCHSNLRDSLQWYIGLLFKE